MRDDAAPDLTASQVADRLGVHQATVIRWADEGRLPYYLTPGGRRRFRPEDIEAIRSAEPRCAS